MKILTLTRWPPKEGCSGFSEAMDAVFGDDWQLIQDCEERCTVYFPASDEDIIRVRRMLHMYCPDWLDTTLVPYRFKPSA